MNLKLLTCHVMLVTLFVFVRLTVQAQCTVNANASTTEITCGECVTLSHFGSTTGNISFQEDFNTQPLSGWAFTQQASFNNPCSPNGADGTDHIWMGDQSGVPRTLETLPLDFGPAVAPAGGTICFDMLFSEQGDASPCEGPDEPDEGVFLQYSTDGGNTWVTIEYFDPNGGNDQQLVNWNNWCFEIPQAALTNNVQFRWFQDADSGAEYDHWGIDNVEIIVNDPTVQYIWQHDGYTTALPGDNPTEVCPLTTTTYTVDMTTATGNCQNQVEIVVVNPVVEVDAGPGQTICSGDCINLAGTASVINDPGGIKTFENNQTENFDASVFGGASVNVNVQDLNMTTVNPGSITEVCLTNLEFTGFGLPPGGVETISVTLVCPDGTQVELVPIGGAPAGAGGLFGNPSYYQNACFVPSGGNAVSGANPDPITGSFSTSQPLSGMDGCTANGVWSIEVSTNAFTGNGTFDGWSITFDDEIDEYTPDVLWSPTTNMALGEETTLGPEVCPTGATTYTLTASDDAGCVTVSDDVSITIDQNCCNPQTPPIQGPTPLCENEVGAVYSVTNTPGSTYTWAVPAGATIVGGQGTNSITVDWGATGGEVSVIETIQCGDGPSITYDVVLESAQTLVITDPAAVCEPNTVDLTNPAITAGSTGGGTLSYWTDVAATNAVANPAAIDASGTYYIQAGGGNCADIQPVNAAVNNCASCNIDGVDVALSDCYISGQNQLQYDAEVTVTFSNPPATGQLVITDCFLNPQTINAPFTSPVTVIFTGLPQDGQDCDFGAVFTDDQACLGTTTYTAPPTISGFQAQCDIGTGVVSGTIDFNNPPATGTLEISINDGTGTQTTSVTPPFNSPENWQVTGLDPAAANYVISYYFSDFPTCEQTLTIQCGCAADVGTVTSAIIGNGLNEIVLCADDQYTLIPNGDHTHPEEDPLLQPYDPAIVFLLYSCPPTPGTFPNDDPCFLGPIPVEGGITDINDVNSVVNTLPPGTTTNGQVYIAPITSYYLDPVAPAVNVLTECWSLGQTFEVTYLPPINTTVTPDCQTNTVTVNVSGGYPEIFGGNFTASNLQPATANFASAVVTNGGDIVVEGLQNGDNYSFDVTDENGCPVTITGGPFVALPVADAGPDVQTCQLFYQLQAVASFGTGTWTGGPVGTTFTPSPNDPNATVSVPSSGNYTFTWTEDNGNGCVSSDDVEIAFSLLSIPSVVTDASCGNADGEIVIAPQGGVAPYTYSWTSGGTSAVESNLGPGNVTVTVTDDTGCSLDSTFTISQPITFSYTVDNQDETCFDACDGLIDIQPDGAGPYTYAWTPNVANSNSSNTLCQGGYEVLVADQDGCTQVVNVTISGPAEVIANVSSDTNNICIGQTAELSALVTGGTAPYGNYLWVASPVDPTLLPTSVSPTVSPEETTTYTLTLADANGCSSSPVSVTVTVLPPLNLEVVRPLFSPDTSICPYDVATIDLQPSGGNGIYSIYLLPDNINAITLPIDTQPSVTTTFEFTVTDGCTTPPAFASSTITIFELPVIDVTALPDSGCEPMTVEFSDQTLPPPTAWLWNFGDSISNSNSSTDQNPTHVYENDGSYDVNLSVTTPDGCSADTTFSNFIDVFPLPNANFNLNPEIVNVLNADIEFTDLSSGNIAAWDWGFGNGNSSTLQNPSQRYTDTGTVNITLLVTTDKGCQDATTRQLIVEPDFMFYVPNAFTPNSDGRNDYFRGYGEGIDWDTYQMSIFNRWGEQIYYTENIEEPWRGLYKGYPVELAVYTWKISLNDLKGEKHDYMGHVSVIR